MQKNPLFFTMWGMAKATDTPVTVWGGQIARKWEESQGRCFWGGGLAILFTYVNNRGNTIMSIKDDKDIFTARTSDWWNNACLNFAHDRSSWYGYYEGYKNAGDILVSYVDSQKSNQDTLVFPIVFMYRHYLELILKEINRISSIILEKDCLKTHDLDILWNVDKKDYEKISGERISKTDLYMIDNFIKQISYIDKKSDSFRYPIHNDGSQSLEGITHINLMQFSEYMNTIYSLLNGLSAYLHEVLDYVLERRYEGS